MRLQQNTDRIQTTHIGSLPRPHDVLDLLRAKFAGQPTCADSRAYRIGHLARRSPSALRSDGIIGRHRGFSSPSANVLTTLPLVLDPIKSGPLR